MYPIYLDYAATTPVDPRVAAEMQRYLTVDALFANPSSPHALGRLAAKAIEKARAQAAELLEADSQEIIWTSGATESNNLAIQGAAYAMNHRGRHIITSLTEHSSVLEVCRHLEKVGFEVTYLKPDSDGRITLADIEKALKKETILLSFMHVNNETGVCQDIEAIGKLARARAVLFHVDAAQGIGKLPLSLQKTLIDLLSCSAHKLYGPKGIGVLYINRQARIKLAPLFYGGGQQRGIRPGTLPVHQIAGMGIACALARQERDQNRAHILSLEAAFLEGLQQAAIAFQRHGHAFERAPGILNLSFPTLRLEKIPALLEQLAVSPGSACQSDKGSPSFVLQALGVEEPLALRSLRFSFGKYTTHREILAAVQCIKALLA